MARINTLIIERKNGVVGPGLQGRLSRLGYSILGVASLEEWVEQATRWEPDVQLRALQPSKEPRDTEGTRVSRPSITIPRVQMLSEADLSDDVDDALDDAERAAMVKTALHQLRTGEAMQDIQERRHLPADEVVHVIWTTDLAMQPTAVSATVSQLLGCSVEEALQEDLMKRLTPASQEVAASAVAEMEAAHANGLDTGEDIRTMTLDFISEDGARVQTNAQTVLLRDSAGEPSGLLWVTQETTQEASAVLTSRSGKTLDDDQERSEAEKELQETREELERTKAALVRARRQRRRTERRLSKLNREWLSLQSAAGAIASSLDLEFVLNAVTQEMTELLDADGCAILRWDRQANAVSVMADYASGPTPRRSPGTSYDLAEYPVGKRMLVERRAHQTSAGDLDAHVARSDYMKKGHIKSLLALPMIYQDRVLGFVEIRDCQNERDFTEREIGLAQMLSTQAASAIENARLYEQAQQEIVQRGQAEAELRRSLKEKDALLQEIHHRVKNNLQVICSLLNLQSESTGEPLSFHMLRESQDRVRSMALIHEKLYQSEDLEKIEFGSYLRDLSSHLMQSYRDRSGRIRLTVRVDDVSLGVEKAVPCGLITNELISNALKHAFPNGREGEISVTLRSGPGRRLTLSVADDGVGLPADLDTGKADSLGLQLIRVLADQMEGTMTLDGSKDCGTEVSITFPAS